MTFSGPTKPSPRPKKARSSLSTSRPNYCGAGRPPRPPAAPAAALFTTAPSSATPLFPASTTDAASALPLFAPSPLFAASPVAPTFAVGSPNRGMAGYYKAPLTPTASTPQHVAGNSPHGSHGLEYGNTAPTVHPHATGLGSPNRGMAVHLGSCKHRETSSTFLTTDIPGCGGTNIIPVM